ncbi:hypothetical protein GCM10020254_45930 [Streptomyces goshikiensis]
MNPAATSPSAGPADCRLRTANTSRTGAALASSSTTGAIATDPSRSAAEASAVVLAIHSVAKLLASMAISAAAPAPQPKQNSSSARGRGAALAHPAERREQRRHRQYGQAQPDEEPGRARLLPDQLQDRQPRQGQGGEQGDEHARTDRARRACEHGRQRSEHTMTLASGSDTGSYLRLPVSPPRQFSVFPTRRKSKSCTTWPLSRPWPSNRVSGRKSGRGA